jgi:hypothetical protein
MTQEAARTQHRVFLSVLNEAQEQATLEDRAEAQELVTATDWHAAADEVQE